MNKSFQKGILFMRRKRRQHRMGEKVKRKREKDGVELSGSLGQWRRRFFSRRHARRSSGRVLKSAGSRQIHVPSQARFFGRLVEYPVEFGCFTFRFFQEEACSRGFPGAGHDFTPQAVVFVHFFT